MKKGDEVWVTDTVGAPVLRKYQRYIVKEIHHEFMVKLEGITGAGFCIHRFTTIPQRKRNNV